MPMRILAISLLALTVAGCSDPDTARRALTANGFTDIEITGYAWFGCGRGDDFSTGFRAKGPAGHAVTGVVCSGWFKGATVRVM